MIKYFQSHLLQINRNYGKRIKMINFYKRKDKVSYKLSELKQPVIREVKVDKIEDIDSEILFSNRKDFIKDNIAKEFNKVAIFDISGFGNINHYYGYDFGEKILKMVSIRLENKFLNGKIYYLGADIFAATSNETVSKDRFVQAVKSIIWYFGYSPIELN